MSIYIDEWLSSNHCEALCLYKVLYKSRISFIWKWAASVCLFPYWLMYLVPNYIWIHLQPFYILHHGTFFLKQKTSEIRLGFFCLILNRSLNRRMLFHVLAIWKFRFHTVMYIKYDFKSNSVHLRIFKIYIQVLHFESLLPLL
jgi:hypothetical protein